ncbi:MAG: hypothetical protein OXT06_29310, partial [Rhodospirillaceae bacterium]|nr:hypothetical protein [Rhodospirillaceae bacterium]
VAGGIHLNQLSDFPGPPQPATRTVRTLSMSAPLETMLRVFSISNRFRVQKTVKPLESSDFSKNTETVMHITATVHQGN